jgi:hypothetical protein
MITIPLVISIISLSLCISGFFFLRWYISRRTAASQLLEEYRDEVFRLISQIDAATDRDSRLVEERIKNLRKILDDTDKRILVYTRELQRSRNSEAIYKNLGRGIREALDSIPVGQIPTAPQETPAPEKPAPQKPVSPAEPVSSTESASSGKKARPSAVNELPFTDEERVPSQTRRSKKQKKNKTANTQAHAARPEKPGIKMQIAQMAIQGLPPSEIASKLGISSAEVDLALQLINIGNKE